VFSLATALVHAGDKDTGRKYAIEARQFAASFGQSELAAALETTLGLYHANAGGFDVHAAIARGTVVAHFVTWLQPAIAVA